MLLVLFPLLSCAAFAENAVLSIPKNTTLISENAFSDCVGISEVRCPSGLERIEDYAFSGCDLLTRVKLPASVVYIADHAFPENIVIECPVDSYAAAWANKHGYETVSPVVRRYALLVGQSYAATPSLTTLPGCLTDVVGMRTMLQTMSGTPYEITVATDLTSTQLLSSIRSAFAEADEDDICLFFYAGHGDYSRDPDLLGALIGTDTERIRLSQLKAAMSAVSGEKIIILDSCYSGNLLSGVSLLSRGEIDLDAVNAAIIRTFSSTPTLYSRQAGAPTGSFHLLTAASATEESFELRSSQTGETYGVFTYAMLYGSGYNLKTQGPLSRMEADTDSNQMITLNECWTYSRASALSISPRQHAQVWPENSPFVLWGKTR